jgi:hypothetical protein
VTQGFFDLGLTSGVWTLDVSSDRRPLNQKN